MPGPPRERIELTVDLTIFGDAADLMTAGSTQAVFPDGSNQVRVTETTPKAINGVAGQIYRTARMEVNIVRARCSDGMSDRVFPDKMQVRVDGEHRLVHRAGGRRDGWRAVEKVGGLQTQYAPSGALLQIDLLFGNRRKVEVHGWLEYRM